MAKRQRRRAGVIIWQTVQGLLICACVMALFGCEEERFRVPKKKRANTSRYKTRMLAAPLARPTPTRRAPNKKAPQARPKAPPAKALTMQTRWGHQGGIQSLAVAPSGAFVLTGGAHELLRWSLPKGRKLRGSYALNGDVKQISFAPAGLRYALLEGSQIISLWSAAGKLLKRIQTPHRLTTLRFAPISNHLIALSQQGQLVRFHGTTLQQERQQQVCPKGQAALALGLDPLQKWSAVGCGSGHIWLGPEDQAGRLYATGSPVQAIAMSPKRPWLAVGTADGRVRLWRVDLKQARATPWTSQQGHFRPVSTLLFSADGATLLSGGRDQHIGVWSVAPGKLTLKKRLRHTGQVTALAWHPLHPKQLIAADDSGYLRVWNTSGGRLLIREPSPLRGGRVTFSPRADQLASHGDKGFAVWDLTSGLRNTASTVHPHPLLTLRFARDGNHLLAVDRENAVFWDLHHRRYVDVVYPPKGGEISAASLGREWTEVWFGTPRHGVFLWTIAGKRLLYRHKTPRYVTAVAYHLGTRRAAAATLRGMLYLYDMTHRRLLLSKKISEKAVTKLAFSPKGDALASIAGQELALWSWRAIQAAPKRRRHATQLTAMRFAPDGKRILLGAADHKLWWWTPGQAIAASKLPGCRTPIRDIDLSRRRPLVAIACQDGTVHVAHTKRHQRISTHIPLAGKEWISFTPQLDFVSSSLALRQFAFEHKGKVIPLDGYQGHFFSPDRLKRTLQRSIR